MIVKAEEALLVGRPVCMHFTGTDDGLLAARADAAADCGAVVGLTDVDIASGDYGLVQVYGYRTDAPMIMASAFSVGQNAPLFVGSASSGYLYMTASIAAATGVQYNFIWAGNTSRASSDTLVMQPVFIRCM